MVLIYIILALRGYYFRERVGVNYAESSAEGTDEVHK